MGKRLPRVICIRHGETEWSLSGQHTGKTDIPLTARGEETMAKLGPRIVGPGKLMDPAHIKHAFISPRIRSQKTFQLLFKGHTLPEHSTEEGVQEWDYGKYEGHTAGEIRAKWDPKWDIWTDGCPEGESADEMSARADAMIEKVVKVTQEHHEGTENDECAGDVIIVSHGHFTRVFLTRWCRLMLTQGRIFVCDAGAVSICGYQHENFSERSLLGMNLYGEI